MTDSNNRSTSPKPVSCATVPDGAKRTAAGSSAAKTVIASIWHTGGGKYAIYRHRTMGRGIGHITVLDAVPSLGHRWLPCLGVTIRFPSAGYGRCRF